METETIMSILNYAVVGAGLTFFIKWAKTNIYLKGVQTKLIVVMLSVLLGAGFYFVKDTPIIPAIIGILSASQVFYGFLVKQSQDNNEIESL